VNKFYGPFMIYQSNDGDQYVDRDYNPYGGNVATQTLRKRLMRLVRMKRVVVSLVADYGYPPLDFLTAAVTAGLMILLGL